MWVHLIKLLCLRLAASAWLGSVGAAAYAQVDCNVINKLAQVYAVQIRFYNNYQTPFAAADLAVIRRPAMRLDNTTVLRAIASNTVAVNASDFSQFITNTDLLIDKIDKRNIAEIRNHFAKEYVVRNLNVVGTALPQFQCEQTADHGIRSDDVTPDATGSVTNLDTPQLELQLSFQNIIVAIVVLAVGYLAVANLRRLARQRKRRAMRYPTSLQTNYMIDGNIFRGRLMDISGKGTKLRHDADGTPSPACELELCLFGDWHGATIAWSNQHYSGLKFKKPLRYEKVRRIHKWHEKQPIAA